MRGIAVLACIVSFGFTAEAITLEKAKGRTEFLAVARPGGIQVNGKGEGPTGDLEIKKIDGRLTMSGEVFVNLKSFVTGQSTRDEHMRKALDVEKYENARLRLTQIALPSQVAESGGQLQVEGILILHGQERPVNVVLAIERKGEVLNAKAKFSVQLTDHGIEPPRFTVMKVANEVLVETETSLPARVFKETL